ncbi:hypothetical protein K1T71_006537 [Dendrolimus kikuchii]|uniref:Uncharacterized protein n=1 Tax=Dendrolimus kikuchii TaxID=765133 RepID=A0ACC1D134_9NEOP|nr:hypothetical protein K1T71_006537 [Dendrolimus kikuchii]
MIMLQNFTVVTLATGKTLLIVNGYTFNKGVRNKNGTVWFCNEPNQTKCNVYLHVNDKYEVVLMDNVHTHEPILCRNYESYDSTIEWLDEGMNKKYKFKVIEKANNSDTNFVVSRKGKTILQYNGHTYRRAYRNKIGNRWICSKNKNCNAYIYTDDDSQVLDAYEEHFHKQFLRHQDVGSDENDSAVVITSRKGKEMLLFRQYTYRKQYNKRDRARWVCSTLKNCRGCVFTDKNNVIISVFENHCHDPPKYYLKPDNVLDALREPVILETD